MGRIRFIKPDFFTDDTIVELNLITRLVFIGLWTIADREGRLENKPRQIKMKLFPADDDVDVVIALHELSRNGLISFYCVDDKEFIEIRNFAKHQRIHPNEAKSILPSPADSCNAIKLNSGITSSSTSSSTSSDAADAAVTPPPEDGLRKPESPNGVSGHPAVVVYEEFFGPVPNAAFAKAVVSTVADLGLWTNLVAEKSSYDKPHGWILGEYQKRIAESPPAAVEKPPGKILTAREANAEARAEEERLNAEFEKRKAQENGTS